MKATARERELSSEVCALQLQYNRLVVQRDFLQNALNKKLSELIEKDALIELQVEQIKKMTVKKK